jgi:large subunit ribosomal protein L13
MGRGSASLPDVAPSASRESGKPSRAAPAAAPPPLLVDATGLILGRAASEIAQKLLRGENVVVVNAERSVVTGSRASVIAEYTARRARGSKRTGPHYPRYPDRIFRRTVRGMVPHLKTRGKEALDRLEVYIGVPPEFTGQATVSLERARPHPALRQPMSLDEICRLLGAKL